MATETQETIDDALLAEALAILDAITVEDPETEPEAFTEELPSDDDEFAVGTGERS